MNLISNQRSQELSNRALRLLKLTAINFLLPALLAVVTFEFMVSREFYPVQAGSAPVYSVPELPLEPMPEMQENYAQMQLTVRDKRAIVLDNYFARYKSPLFGKGDYFVKMCDKYALPYDCTLLPAIAYTETKLCTKNITAKQYNCWGWGGSGSNRFVFKNYEEAIDFISRRMKEEYWDNLKKPELVAPTYCGGHCLYWADAVEDQQKEIDLLARSLGFSSLFK